MKKIKRKNLGFKQAFEYILDLLCYAYYVKADNLVSDQTFDELEKLYCKTFNVSVAPCRGLERKECYNYGIQFIYDFIKGKKKRKT